MLKISIIDGHHQALSRTTKTGVRYYQEAYAHLGGAFPQKIEVPLQAPADASPIGDYSLDISNFQAGKYKNLELNPFELKLIPFNAKGVSKAA
jgi:hypothetical protein